MSYIAIAGAVVQIGMGAASAAGAFSDEVDPLTQTPEEGNALKYNNQVFQQGQQWQKALDPIYLNRLDTGMESMLQQGAFLKQAQNRLGGIKRELNTLKNPGMYQGAANRSVSQAWQKKPGLNDVATATASRSGGPGSGQFFAGLGSATSAMDAGVRGANLQGRLGYLDQYNKSRGQYGQRLNQFGQRLDMLGSSMQNYANATEGLFSDYANRIQAGLSLMNRGAEQAAGARDDRINAQIRNNIAANQGAGQMGAMVGGAMGTVGGIMNAPQ